MTENQASVKHIKAAGFLGYDLTLHSKCKQPQVYGIRRIPAAERALVEQAKSPHKDTRKFMRRMYYRLPESEYSDLLNLYARSNCKTWQEFQREIVQEYIAKDKKKVAFGVRAPKATR